MKVLQMCPLWFPVAQDAHGGIETFLTRLIAALIERGCEVTLLASGDSRTAAELIPVVPTNLYDQMQTGDALEYSSYEQHQLRLALERAAEFDVVHSHVGSGAYLLSGLAELRGRVLHTVHTPVLKDQEWFVRHHPDIWLSTVSEFQARKFWQQGSDRCEVIHNGIDVAEFTFQPRGGAGLLFVGRMEKEKGPDLAIKAARSLGCPLLLAGPIVDEVFFDHLVRPFLSDSIQYIGVVDHGRKNELFGQADCVLMPSRCEEGFGMVSVEAMACGTPVVALAHGALPEVIEPGLTGYVTQDEEGLAPLAAQAMKLDRNAIRARVAARFDMSAVAEKYHQLYLRIAAHSTVELDRIGLAANCLKRDR